MKKDHDYAYKQLFSEPEIVKDLLQGFVHEDWVKELDFSTLEKSPAVMYLTICALAKMMLSGGSNTGKAGYMSTC